MTDSGIVFMTASSHDEAELIARVLVEKRLAACVQIHPEIRSLYCWEGRVCDEAEILFTAKTTRACFDELVVEVKKLHSYRVPEIIFVSIADAPSDYQRWIAEVTK